MILIKFLVTLLACPALGFLNRSSNDPIRKLLYDDAYLTDDLDEVYPYLKLPDGSYIGPRDYFNFSNVFEPTEEYYDSVNIETRIYDELKAMEITASIATMDQWHYTNPEEEARSGWPEANEQGCLDDLALIAGHISRARNDTDYLMAPGKWNIQFWRYIDSWGRPPSETYLGHSYWFGSYRGCRIAQLARTREDPADLMAFRYCLAKMKAKDWPEEDDLVPPVTVRVGVCLPRSCDTQSARRNLETIRGISEFNFSPVHKERFNRLVDIYCLPNRQGLPQSGRIFVRMVAIWLSVVLAASLCVRYTRYAPSWLVSISIQENYSRFVDEDLPPDLNDERTKNKVDLRALGVARLVASLGVIFGHSFTSSAWVLNSSTLHLLESRKLRYNLVIAGLKTPDIFMVITGLVTAYVMLGKMARRPDEFSQLLRPVNYIKINVARYLRLAPMAVIVLAFIKAIYPSLSDGPNWDYGTYRHSMQGQCQESSWWRVLLLPILFGHNGNGYYHECSLVSWHLVADLKVALVSPLIVYVMSRSERCAWLTVLSSLVISALVQYKNLMMQNILYFSQFYTYGPAYASNILSLTFGETNYYSVLNRQNPLVVGMFGGLWLRNYRDGKLAKWPFWMRGWFFASVLAYQVYDIFAPIFQQAHYYQTGEKPTDDVMTIASALKPRIDAIMFTIIALRLCSDLAPKVMEFCSIHYRLSKLSYCVFLIHSTIIAYCLSAYEYSRPASETWPALSLLIITVFSSYLISLPLYLLFESPLALLLGLLTASTNRRHTKSSDKPSVAKLAEAKSS